MRGVKRERAEEASHPDENGGEDVYIVPTKEDCSDRRLLRARYRELKTQVTDRRGELAQADVVDFKAYVGRVDKIHGQVKRPREQITDAELLVDITNELLVLAKGTQVKGGLTAAEFIGAVIHNYGLSTDDGGLGQPMDWEALGFDTCAVVRHAPGMSTMVGPMDVEIKARKPVVNRRRERPTEKTCPQEVKEASADRPNTETDANMSTMFEILIERGQVQTDHLILNRASFAQTIENLFALSFLVKDGRAEIKFADDGSQFVIPRNAPAHADRAGGEVSNTQFVFRLDFQCWRLMQEMVPEGEEVMPHREKIARTPIRKNSRNRARETLSMGSQSESREEGGSQNGSSRHLKRKLL